MQKVITIFPVYQKRGYARNFEKNCHFNTTCDCCGNYLNPHAAKRIQVIGSSYWTEEQNEIKSISGTTDQSTCFKYICGGCFQDIMNLINNNKEDKKLTVEL